jgi:vacuolar-type H+-ATPase subunit H
MSIEIINEIKLAEERAAHIIKSATGEADEIVAAAQHKAMKIGANAIEQTELMQKQILNNAESLAGERAKKIETQAIAESALIRRSAEPRIKKVVDIILEGIVEL